MLSKGKKAKPQGEEQGGDESSDIDSEAKATPPKKTTATLAVELEAELMCDRKKGEKCEHGKCWKERIDETGEVIHHPINPRDASFWLASLVCRTPGPPS